jgi:glucitol/sorbitol PTS system EIIA component
MIKYQAHFTSIGPMVNEFLEHNVLVIFGSNAPEELVEFSVIHDGKELHEPIAVGDTITIDTNAYLVLAVGPVVNTNLANLGHLVLKFNGESTTEMPGDVCLEEKPLPPIRIGTILTITRGFSS